MEIGRTVVSFFWLSISWCIFRFSIALDELLDGEEIATCPSCTLRIRIIYDYDTIATKYSIVSPEES